MRGGSTKPKTSIRSNEYHNTTLLNQVFCVHSYQMWCLMTFDSSSSQNELHAAFFSQEEHVVIMENYREYKKMYNKKTILDANKVSVECQQKICELIYLNIQFLLLY